ncbi:BOS complex subunit TMEM147-like [Halichondria panicea]|uniref:BOS complex subunit TMEM147-like n=1 Tax=Halichondria panicea TaxID=6063 RepID=UPI00312BC45D
MCFSRWPHHLLLLVQIEKMTLFHFVNCIGAAYAPYFITYRFCGLSEYSSFWKCVRAGTAYIVTQLVKMLILATLFPLNAAEEHGNPVLGEALKSTVDLLDMLGMYLVITRLLGRSEQKVLVTAVGWGTAEMVMTKVLPLWVGARGVEFEWTNLQSALDSNLNLLFLIVVNMLLWLWNRKDLNKSLLPLLATFLLVIYYRPVLLEIVQLYYGMDPWGLIIAKLLFVTVTGVVTLRMYGSMSNLSH